MIVIVLYEQVHAYLLFENISLIIINRFCEYFTQKILMMVFTYFYQLYRFCEYFTQKNLMKLLFD